MQLSNLRHLRGPSRMRCGFLVVTDMLTLCPLVCRLMLARETDKNQSVAIDYFLNTSQCNLDPRLWEDMYSSDWLYKRETHAEGEVRTVSHTGCWQFFRERRSQRERYAQSHTQGVGNRFRCMLAEHLLTASSGVLFHSLF